MYKWNNNENNSENQFSLLAECAEQNTINRKGKDAFPSKSMIQVGNSSKFSRQENP